jgi:hypothetical protein
VRKAGLAKLPNDVEMAIKDCGRHAFHQYHKEEAKVVCVRVDSVEEPEADFRSIYERNEESYAHIEMSHPSLSSPIVIPMQRKSSKGSKTTDTYFSSSTRQGEP